MSFIILLDSGPLGLVTHPKASPEADACKQWLQRLPEAGHLQLIPAIIDYELRREILRRNNVTALRLLDRLKLFGYLPLTENALIQAAHFWATARQQGIPTADPTALDADMILAGQAASMNPVAWQMLGATIVVATANVGHLSRFVDARLWQNIL